MPQPIPTLRYHTIQFGCDPEFFFQKAGKIVGSEKVIDIKKGLEVNELGINGGSESHDFTGKSKFIVDGVQAELNPRPDTCRARLTNEISACFRMLARQIEADPALSINFAPTVKITSEELKSLDKKSRVFGCMPSKNAQEKGKSAVKLRDPKIYKYRSAGGHIHISPDKYSSDKKRTTDIIFNQPERLITIMDIIVGNTCVLIDRDPSNKERRKVYGRAGEYRTPKHGLEYRTLSNFWLRSSALMSFVMALTRMSVSIMGSSDGSINYEKELLKLVNLKQIQKAINNNDFDLALKNYKKIKEFIIDYSTESFPLNSNNADSFEFFIKKGIDFWFTEDPLHHWIHIPEGHSAGWESFIASKVKPLMLQEQKGTA